MKTNVPPGVATLVIAIMAVIIGMIYWKFASPGAKAVEMEKAIQATVIQPPAGWKPGQPVKSLMPMGAAPGKASPTAPGNKK